MQKSALARIAHWLLNAELTATSMIGFIAQAGIEVHNSILLVVEVSGCNLRPGILPK